MDNFSDIDFEIKQDFIAGSNISKFIEKLLMMKPDDLEIYLNRLGAISYQEGYTDGYYSGDYREDILS